jgi:hypothetical protein
MMELSRNDITRLLSWYRTLRAQKLDGAGDEALAGRLFLEEQRLYELERTR